jgi:hypothetical protein
MTQYQKIRTKPKQFKALCSITIEQFDILLPIFEGKWLDFIEGYTLDGQPRVRKYTPKNEEQLPTAADKLFWYFMILLAKFNLTAAADRPTLSFLERALSSLLLQGQGRLSGRVRDEVEFPKCK